MVRDSRILGCCGSFGGRQQFDLSGLSHPLQEKRDDVVYGRTGASAHSSRGFGL